MTSRFHPTTVLLPHGDHSPQVHERAFIAPNVSMIGDVEIGDESSVWFGTTIRGDVMPIRVGARTSIQDGSVIHATEGWAPTVVGDDCVIGHKVILHGCTIGNRVLVGMGAIVLDEVEVGDDVLIGAGALVTARTKIPSGSLVLGSPAKVRRELSPEERAAILEGAAHYVDKTRKYLKLLGGS